MVSWSDMSNDALEYVTRFLPFTDQVRFSAVCQSWRYAAKQKRCPPAPELPWLILGENEETKKRNFFNITEERAYSIDIPELYGQYILGSSYGWVFTVDKTTSNFRLLNPFTRECFRLPPYWHYAGCSFEQMQKEVSHDPPYTFRCVREEFVQKFLLSHDPKKRADFTVVMVFGERHSNDLLMWKPGEKVWTIKMPKRSLGEPRICFRDVICFQEKFYVVSTVNDIYAFEVGSQPERILRLSMPQYFTDWLYFVDFQGKLLLVLNDTCFPRDEKYFKVYEVDSKNGTYCQWHDLQSHAIFVGSNSAVVVDPQKSCIQNGIYFGDVFTRPLGRDQRQAGVYDMISGSLRMHCSGKNPVLDPRDAAHVWFTPNA